jgi:DNA invertase Pin-like site-specific DNA recombinase
MTIDIPRQAIAYIRVSTARQAEEGISLDAQRARIAAYCAAHGLMLQDGAVFVEAGKSGTGRGKGFEGTLKYRPELARALEAVKRTQGVLVVYSLSRLARSTRDTMAISERLERANADLVSLCEAIDTTSAAGRMIFRVLAVLAEFESDIISERTTDAAAHQRAQGRRTSGIAPFGYRFADDGKTLLPNASELSVVKNIHQMRASGRGFEDIARALESQNIRARNGARFSRKVVRSICIRKSA